MFMPNCDVHTKFRANLSALSKTEMRNAIYRQRGELMTTFPLTRGELALKKGFLLHIKTTNWTRGNNCKRN
jgi:hypothetical protein